MKSYFHSVVLDKSKCRGCTTCVKGCPTQAIRVRKGKAGIIQEKCIDCGKCIRICPHYAKNAITDSLDSMKEYSYKVALVPPAMIAQFKSHISVNKILTAIKSLGFDEVVEVAYGSEILGEALQLEQRKNTYSKPAIPITCPAVVELIQVKFPELISHLVKLETPYEVVGRITKQRLMTEKSLTSEEIGIFYLTPCASKAARIHDNNSCITDAISIKDIYPLVLEILHKVDKEEPLQIAQTSGKYYTNSTVGSSVLSPINSISVDGIDDVTKILEKIERGDFEDTDYFVGFACTGSCAGGCLTLENSFIANKRIMDRVLKENSPNQLDQEFIEKIHQEGTLDIKEEILPRTIQPLDSDLKTAIEKMKKMDIIEKSLPGLDCGSCGAPSCKSLAEDIVRGYAKPGACIFLLKEAINNKPNIKKVLTENIISIPQKKDDSNGKDESTASNESIYVAK